MAKQCGINYGQKAEDIINLIHLDHRIKFDSMSLTFHLFDVANLKSQYYDAINFVHNKYNSSNINDIYIFVMNYSTCNTLCPSGVNQRQINYYRDIHKHNIYYVFVPPGIQCDDSIIIYMSLHLNINFKYTKDKIKVHTNDEYDKSQYDDTGTEFNNFRIVEKKFFNNFSLISNVDKTWEDYVTLSYKIINNLGKQKLSDLVARTNRYTIESYDHAVEEANKLKKEEEKIMQVNEAVEQVVDVDRELLFFVKLSAQKATAAVQKATAAVQEAATAVQEATKAAEQALDAEKKKEEDKKNQYVNVQQNQQALVEQAKQVVMEFYKKIHDLAGRVMYKAKMAGIQIEVGNTDGISAKLKYLKYKQKYLELKKLIEKK